MYCLAIRTFCNFEYKICVCLIGRQLWMVTDKRDEMLSLNTVRCVAILLTTECESAGIIKSANSTKESDGLRKSQEELITGILKCLGYFTTYTASLCAEQVYI